ncbi:MAG: hypothetical protein AUI08_11685 [Gemmatimonadetes bacterium 13_2_20CM_2_65_7]|nr:MAG: hypothetical protein AUI08_11685 [Gemmatimonadetes bacterium 13_2_20CM_2_65_7]
MLDRDFERFKRGLPRDFPGHVRETHRIDLSARYLGQPIPHPVGKGSGQLSLNAGQLESDAEAGLAFAVLKTVIAQNAAGVQSMAAWAIHETKMRVERRGDGWTVTWKGRGWDRSFDDYLALVRAGRDLTRAGRLLTLPSVKYHLPRLDEPFRDDEYAFTTRALADAWGESPLLQASASARVVNAYSSSRNGCLPGRDGERREQRRCARGVQPAIRCGEGSGVRRSRTQ